MTSTLANLHGWIGHDGLVPGYQSLAFHLLAARATMVILINTDINPPHGDAPALLAEASVRRTRS